jgi:hypothetical protein
MESEKSFFESLFDFSFTYFITSKIIKFLYGLCIAGSGILALVLVIGGFNMAPGIGILTLAKTLQATPSAAHPSGAPLFGEPGSP